MAAAEPLPGGGSAAALAGALAAALGEMMAGVTEGREKFAAVESQVLEIHAKMTGFRKVLQALVQEDADAYRSSWMRCGCPGKPKSKDLPAQMQSKNPPGAQPKLRCAQRVQPFEVLEYLKILIEIGNPNARSDVAVGAQLAFASLKGGQYNVLANIRSVERYVLCRQLPHRDLRSRSQGSHNPAADRQADYGLLTWRDLFTYRS